MNNIFTNKLVYFRESLEVELLVQIVYTFVILKDNDQLSYIVIILFYFLTAI